jgi:hypothetical protein
MRQRRGRYDGAPSIANHNADRSFGDCCSGINDGFAGVYSRTGAFTGIPGSNRDPVACARHASAAAAIAGSNGLSTNSFAAIIYRGEAADK